MFLSHGCKTNLTDEAEICEMIVFVLCYSQKTFHEYYGQTSGKKNKKVNTMLFRFIGHKLGQSESFRGEKAKKTKNSALLALSSAFLFTLNSAVTQHVTRQQSLSNQTGEALMCKRFTLMFPDASVFMRLLQSCVVWSFWTLFQCFHMWMCRSFPAEQANILWNRQFMWHYFLIRRRNFTLCVKMWNPDVKKQISCDFTCAVLFLHVDILMYMGKISHRDVFIFMWKSD